VFANTVFVVSNDNEFGFVTWDDGKCTAYQSRATPDLIVVCVCGGGVLRTINTSSVLLFFFLKASLLPL